MTQIYLNVLHGRWFFLFINVKNPQEQINVFNQFTEVLDIISPRFCPVQIKKNKTYLSKTQVIKNNVGVL